MTARELKDRLYARHHASAAQMPGPWTVIEEYRGIDVLAFSAWQSAGRYARVGYEVKVSRSDLRRELLAPGKRQRNVEWCNEFYFAIPRDLLTADELSYEEPEWAYEDFARVRCPGIPGARCAHYGRGLGGGARIRVPLPTTNHRWTEHEYVLCPTCGGVGYTDKSRVEKEAPTCWIPRDVGLVLVDGRGTQVARPSPKRKDVPTLSAAELGQFVRWVSMRPDPRHHPARTEAVA